MEATGYRGEAVCLQGVIPVLNKQTSSLPGLCLLTQS